MPKYANVNFECNRIYCSFAFDDLFPHSFYNALRWLFIYITISGIKLYRKEAEGERGEMTIYKGNSENIVSFIIEK